MKDYQDKFKIGDIISPPDSGFFEGLYLVLDNITGLLYSFRHKKALYYSMSLQNNNWIKIV